MPHRQERDDVGVTDARQQAGLLAHRARPLGGELPRQALDAHFTREAEQRLGRARAINAAGRASADAREELEALAREAGDDPRGTPGSWGKRSLRWTGR